MRSASIRCDAVESDGIRVMHAVSESSAAPAAGPLREADGCDGDVWIVTDGADPDALAGSSLRTGCGGGSAAAMGSLAGIGAACGAGG